jgi:hypothetical protein
MEPEIKKYRKPTGLRSDLVGRVVKIQIIPRRQSGSDELLTDRMRYFVGVLALYGFNATTGEFIVKLQDDSTHASYNVQGVVIEFYEQPFDD